MSLIILLDSKGPPNGFVVQTTAATGLFTNQRRAQQRRPFLAALRGPAVIAPPTPSVGKSVPTALAVNQRVTRVRRGPYSILRPPVFYPSTSDVATAVVRTRPRRTHWFLTAVRYPQASTVTENEVFVATVIDDRRRRIPRSRLQPPVFYPQASTVDVATVRTRPRSRTAYVAPPVLVLSPAPQSVTIGVTLAHTRPRLTHSFLAAPITPFVQPAGIATTLVAVGRMTSQKRRFPCQCYEGTPAEAVTPPGSWEAAVTASSPSHWWRLGEAAGVTATDSVGGLDGTYSGGLKLAEESLIVGDTNTSVSFGATGSNGQVAIPGTVFAGQSNATIELWISPRSVNSGANLYREVGSGNDRFSFIMSAAGGGIAGLGFVYVEDNGTTDANNAVGGAGNAGVPVAKHVVLTRNGNTVTSYINGVQAGGFTGTLGPQTDATITALIGDNFRGWIDEVVAYPRTLAAPEILAHYRAGAIGPTPALVFISRCLGPRPPRLIISIPRASIVTKTLIAVVRRDDGNRRSPHSFFLTPNLLAQPPPVVTTVAVTETKTRPRRTHSTLAPPTVLQTFGPPVELLVKTVIDDRQRRGVRSFEIHPVVSPATSEIAITLAHTRPRKTRSFLTAISYPATSTITVETVRTRPRKTHSFLSAVTYPQATPLVEREVAVTTVQDDRRRRRTRSFITAVSYPATSKISTTLVRTRPRPTRHSLTAISYPQTSVVETTIVRTRPRPTTTFLNPPSTLQVFPGPTETEVVVKTVQDDRRRRQPRSFAIRPVTLPAQSEISVTAVRTRPRRTHSFLTAISYPATSHIATTLVQTRPRRTHSALFPPTTLRVFPGPVETEVFVKTVVDDRRRRAPRSFPLGPVTYPQTSVIRTQLVRIRPRPFAATVNPPTVLQVFDGPTVSLVTTRPRKTTRFFVAVPPERIPSVEQREQTIQVTDVRTRPRPTRHFLNPPTVVRVPSVEQVEQTIRVTLVHTRPRPTTRTLRPPTVIVVNPPVVTTILSTLVAVRTRVEHQRHVVEHFLRPPTVVIPLPTLRVQTIQTTLVHTRPRPTRHFLTAVAYRATSKISTTLVRTRPRPTRRFLTAVSYPAVSEITTKLVATRPRPIASQLAPPTALQVFPPIEVETAIQTVVVDRLRRGVHSRLAPPVFYAALGQVKTTLAQTRPRPTRALLRAPTTLQTFAASRPAVVRSRPRPTTTILAPPIAIATSFEGVRVALTPSQRRAAHSRLPLVLVAQEIHRGAVAPLVHTRPRRTSYRLAPPSVVAVTPPTLGQQKILVVITPPRPRIQTVSKFHPIPALRTLPSWTTGETVPAAGGSAESTAAALGESEAVPSAGASAESVAGGSGTIEAIGAGVAEIHDERGGLPE